VLTIPLDENPSVAPLAAKSDTSRLWRTLLTRPVACCLVEQYPDSERGLILPTPRNDWRTAALLGAD
jgi:hypothetical protein